MDIRSLLETQVETLQTLYERNIEAVRALQKSLVDEILPSLADELELGSETVESLREWLEDTRTSTSLLSIIFSLINHVTTLATIFRILRVRLAASIKIYTF